MRAVVIVPTYNEAENITSIVGRILEALPDANVLVVDDASPDGTAAIVETLRERDPRVDLRRRPAKDGLGSAYIETFSHLAARADVDVVCTIDADFSHDPAMLPSLVAEAERSDVVVGSRYMPGGRIEGWSRWRRAISWGGNVYARIVARVPVRDLTSGFVCFKRPVFERIPLETVTSSGYAYTIESKCLAYRAGARIQEIPITFVERRGGRSKFSARIVAEGVLAPWRVRVPRRGRDGRR